MPQQESSTLLQKRGALKGQLTRTRSFLSAFKEGDDIDLVKLRMEKLSELWEKFNSVQDEIEEEGSAEDGGEREREAFETNYFESLALAKRLVARSEPVPCRADSESISGASTAQPAAARIKLPDIRLPRFSGEYDEWLSFRETFESVIEQNDSLPKVQKFQYLKACLYGDAAKILHSLEASNENYRLAWDLLKERYSNERVIVLTHVRRLLGLAPIQRESAKEIRALVDEAMKHLRALDALGLPTDKWDALLYPIITDKLDRLTRTEWERSSKGAKVPKMADCWEFLREKCITLESMNIEASRSHSGKFREPLPPTTKRTQTFVAAQSNQRCPSCSAGHRLFECQKYMNMTVEQRGELVATAKLCFNCLRPGHRVAKCTSVRCQTCQKRHHTSLHGRSVSGGNEENREQHAGQIPSINMIAEVPAQVLLSTAVVNMIDRFGKTQKCRILLDSGSQANFITKRFADQLGLPQKISHMPVAGFGGNRTSLDHSVSVKLSSRNKTFEATVTYYVTPAITECIPGYTIKRSALRIPGSLRLADPEFHVSRPIEALVGAELFCSLLCVGQIRIPNTGATLQKTKLGWIISGRIPASVPREVQCNTAIEKLGQQLEAFWRLETVKEVKHLSAEERSCEEHYATHVQRDSQGRYVVALPFRTGQHEIGANFEATRKRFLALEHRFTREPKLGQEYAEFLREYEALGHMEALGPATDDGHYYIPHQAVCKPGSATTKLRVVFNASAKPAIGKSLNAVLMTGPALQDDVFTLVVRFRSFVVALTADVEKMYRQVRVREVDASQQRILWRADRNQPFLAYQLNTLTYGTTSAPYLAVRTLLQLAQDEGKGFPMAAKVSQRDFYVDDLLTGANDVETAIKLRDELVELLGRGGFNLRKWASSDPQLLTGLAERSTDPHVTLSGGEAIKTLGVQWHPFRDTLTYTVARSEHGGRVTKRRVLSETASLFDPLGLLAPVIIKAKLIMQRTWLEKLEWDESMPQDIEQEWIQLRNQLPLLEQFEVERRFAVDTAEGTEMHTFCDASERAYGACVYARSRDSAGSWHARLIAAKTRVAPVKTVSLPRLELCAAVLAARLYEAVRAALPSNIIGSWFWSDSTVVLQWLRTSPHKLKTFVANRVAEVQEKTNTELWRHVPSGDNPADMASRGLFPADLLKAQSWTTGPSWLASSEETWPASPVEAPTDEIPELKHIIALSTVEPPDYLQRFSTFSNAIRVTAQCLRFGSATRGRERQTSRLTTNELRTARNKILKLIQQQAFPRELDALRKKKEIAISSKLRSLNPVLDAEGLLRVGGRLRRANIAEESKHPAILPGEHPIVAAMIREAHINLLHAGAQQTLYHLRQTVWIVNGRNCVRRVLRKCVTCCRARPTAPQYKMGELPAYRVQPARPFQVTGVDYAGPFLIKEKKCRNRGFIKIYVAIFVCGVSKAVHIEVVGNLSAEGFIAALRRFFARRGKAEHILSDNATNFVGANRELQELAELAQAKELDRFATREGITWNFIPPRTPHFGGIWEAAVRSFKHHLRRVAGDAKFTYEEFYTLCVEIEAVLNSRPLTPLSTDPDDLTPLTPSHFLIGSTPRSIPEPSLYHLPTNRLSVWQHITRVKQDFWKRWQKEYLNELQQRSKWATSGEPIKEGDMVLLKDDNLPPMRWSMGRVLQVHPGDDGVVRVVTLKTAHGHCKRGVKQVVRLPTES